jgi:hypothetical protein
MDVLKLINKLQSDEYKYRLRRETLEHLCGFNLTDYQIGVLMAECVNDSQTIYASQPRATGTSTALLLKVYQSIFLENNLNNKHVLSKNNNNSSYMKNQMMNILGRANLLDHIRRESRFRIEFDNGCSIHFENYNPMNLIGVGRNHEFFFDDYTVSNETQNEELNAAIRVTQPIHVHYFLSSNELEEQFTQLLFD